LSYHCAMNNPAALPEGLFHSSAPMDAAKEKDPSCNLAYLVIAVVAFIAGMLFAGLSKSTPSGSRIAWPPAETLRPHPGSPQP
jgi:hypothetical protein